MKRFILLFVVVSFVAIGITYAGTNSSPPAKHKMEMKKCDFLYDTQSEEAILISSPAEVREDELNIVRRYTAMYKVEFRRINKISSVSEPDQLFRRARDGLSCMIEN